MPVTLFIVILLLLQEPLLSQPSPLESPQSTLLLLSLASPPLLLLLSATPPLLPPLDLLFGLGLLLPFLVLVVLVLFRAPLSVLQLSHEVPISLPVEAVAVVDELSAAADAVGAVVPVPSPRMAP